PTLTLDCATAVETDAAMTTANNASSGTTRHPAALLAVAAGLLAGASPAARSAEAAQAPETIVLKAAHLFDSTGTALKDSAIVVVRGDRIVSVGTAAAPAGARVIDLGDATLLPGFIDAHTHLTLEFQKDYYHFIYDRHDAIAAYHDD